MSPTLVTRQRENAYWNVNIDTIVSLYRHFPIQYRDDIVDIFCLLLSVLFYIKEL